MKTIDYPKLHNTIRKLRRDELSELLIRATEQLPKTRLPKVFAGIIDLDEITTTGKNTNGNKPTTNNTQSELLTEVEHFHTTSLAGQYYESFRVNSRNFMEKSEGTEEWIHECNRLFKRCISEAKQSHKTTCKALAMLIELLLEIDECKDNIIFFADEAGSWQVNVDWDKVLPVWFTCLAKTAEPTEFAKKSLSIIKHFVDHDRKKFLAIARKKATAEQRKALPAE